MSYRVAKVQWRDKWPARILPLYLRSFFDQPEEYGKWQWWVVLEGVRVVAIQAVSLLGAKMFTEALHVEVAHRGHGLQRKLIRAREAWGRKNGITCSYSDTELGNIYSTNNLIREGYLMFLPRTPWRQKKSLYFRKAL